MESRSGDKAIIRDGSVYHRWRGIHEVQEYQPICLKHKNLLFGNNIVIYLDLRKKISSLAGTGSIPDGIMLTVGKDDELRMWLVEYELEGHILSDHVIKQLTNFVLALENQDTKNELWNILNDEIEKDATASKRLDAVFGTKKPLRHLTSLMSQKPGIAIVIDKLPPETDLLEVIARIDTRTGIEPTIIEFTPFRNERGELAFLSDSLESNERQRSIVHSASYTITESNSDLASVVRTIIKGYRGKIFDISQVNKDAASQLPDLVLELGKLEFYHRVRAAVFALKSKRKLKKVDTLGHSGEYQQIQSF